MFDLWKPEVLRQVRVAGAAREAALVFLEADPWFFRSGYLKERLLRAIKGAQLALSQWIG
jgi:hypothetical protein